MTTVSIASTVKSRRFWWRRPVFPIIVLCLVGCAGSREVAVAGSEPEFVVSGDLPGFLDELPSHQGITKLAIHDGRLSDDSLRQIARQLPRVEFLAILDCPSTVTDQGLSALASVSGLRTVVITSGYEGLSDGQVRGLCRLSQVRDLWVSDLRDAKQLHRLDLRRMRRLDTLSLDLPRSVTFEQFLSFLESNLPPQPIRIGIGDGTFEIRRAEWQKDQSGRTD